MSKFKMDVSSMIKYLEDNDHCNLYIDLNELSLHNKLYKNVPSLRTKIIINTKSYNFNKHVLNTLKLLHEAVTNTKFKIIVVTNDKTIIEFIISEKLNIKILPILQFQNNLLENKCNLLAIINVDGLIEIDLLSSPTIAITN